MTADQGGEDVDGGGLAGAIAAEEAEDGALLDRQADPADRRYRPKRLVRPSATIEFVMAVACAGRLTRGGDGADGR